MHGFGADAYMLRLDYLLFFLQAIHYFLQDEFGCMSVTEYGRECVCVGCQRVVGRNDTFRAGISQDAGVLLHDFRPFRFRA